jgi:hypothetical protein
MEEIVDRCHGSPEIIKGIGVLTVYPKSRFGQPVEADPMGGEVVA